MEPTASSSVPRRRSRRRIVAAVLLVLVAVLVGAYVVASSVVYDAVSIVEPHCGGRFADNTPAAYTIDPVTPVVPSGDPAPSPVTVDPTPYLMPDYQSVTVPSRDPGIDLSAWYIPGADGPTRRAVVLVHGHGSCKREDRILLAAGMLHRAGIGALLIDLRNHGDSTVVNGRYAGGTREFKDVLGAWDWLVERQGYAPDRVGIYGQSLGAATSLIATGEEQRVAAVWADSSFADLDQAIAAELERDGYPAFVRYGGYAMAELRSGDDLLAYSPLTAVAKLHGRPIFLTMGLADHRLSPTYAADLAREVDATGGHVDPWMVPGADHTEAIVLATAEYERRLDAFFESALGGTTS